MEFSDCVEGHITGVSLVDESKAVSIAFRAQSRVSFTILAEGLDRFVADEFRERNIVDRVVLWDAMSNPSDYRELLRTLLSGKGEGLNDSVWSPLVEAEVTAIEQGKKVLLSVEPVYGVGIVLLAKGVRVVHS